MVGEHVNSGRAYRRDMYFSWTDLPAGRLAPCDKAALPVSKCAVPRVEP